MTDRTLIPEPLRSLRVALVHDYLNQPGGAEKVVEVFTEMFPGAPIYTSVYDRKAMPDVWRGLDVRTSFMQSIWRGVSGAKMLLPLFPSAFESFDLREYDLVLSSTTAFAKGVITQPETCHVCYCNSPTRFLWRYNDYVRHERFPPGTQRFLPLLATPLRVWDYNAAQRVDYFVAGSHNAARRIAKHYRRESDVVQAPIEVSRFTPSGQVEDYFLVVSRLQSYKAIHLAVEACSRLDLPLRVIGDGPDRPRLQAMAGTSVRFLGRLPDGEVRQQMARARALIVPGEEDYGLAPLEAQASGRPVIAYRAGGALETIREGRTGLYFDEPTADSLAQVLAEFEDIFDPTTLRAHAQAFDTAVFKQRLYAVLAQRYAEYRERFR